MYSDDDDDDAVVQVGHLCPENSLVDVLKYSQRTRCSLALIYSEIRIRLYYLAGVYERNNGQKILGKTSRVISKV